MKKFTLKQTFVAVTALAFLVGGIILGSEIFPVEAAPSPVSGWAWSDMPTTSDQSVNPSNARGGRGFGWIQMSGPWLNGVSFDGSSGLFTGYAWSGYGGWLQFNPSGATPDGTSSGAFISTDCLQGSNPTCPVEGWIKFLSGGTPQSGGWDGWVHMSGSWQNGVSFTKATGSITGYAWGGHVAGWIEFNAQANTVQIDTCPNIVGDQDISWMNQNDYRFNGQIPPICIYDQCYLDTNADGYWDFFDGNNPQCIQGGQVDITATACNAGSSTITWNSWDPSGSVSCTASGGSGFSGTVGPTGSISVSNLPDGQTTFTLGPCTDSAGATITDFQSQTTTASTIVQCGAVQNPTPLGVTLSDNDSCKANVSAVSWTLTNGTPSTTCSISSTGGFGFSIPTPPTSSGSDIVTVDQTGITTFILSCSDPVNGTSSDATQFACGVQLPPETCNGIDDDLDGQIDEGCPGVPTGGVNPIYQET